MDNNLLVIDTNIASVKSSKETITNEIFHTSRIASPSWINVPIVTHNIPSNIYDKSKQLSNKTPLQGIINTIPTMIDDSIS